MAVATVIVDTNVIAYWLLKTEPFFTGVRKFWLEPRDIHAPEHWQAEFANVVWKSTRAAVLTRTEAMQALRDATELPILGSPVARIWEPAVDRSLVTGLALYDTLFVELADQLGCPLVTFDQAVLRAYPAIACRPRDLA